MDQTRSMQESQQTTEFQKFQIPVTKPRESKKKVIVIILITVLVGVILILSHKLLTLQPPKPLRPGCIKLPCERETEITYIWIGGEMPEKYKQQIEDMNYPYRLIGIKEYRRYEKMYNITVELPNIQKADFLRVAYIQQFGGIYADFDNEINYCCIMDIIRNKTGFIFQLGSSNSFFVSREEHAQILINILANVSGRVNQTIPEFMGPWAFDRVWDTKLIQSIDFGTCIVHRGDYTWNAQPNQPHLMNNSKPPPPIPVRQPLPQSPAPSPSSLQQQSPSPSPQHKQQSPAIPSPQQQQQALPSPPLSDKQQSPVLPAPAQQHKQQSPALPSTQQQQQALPSPPSHKQQSLAPASPPSSPPKI